MNLHERLAEERRLCILRLLAEMPENTANESVVGTGLDHFGLPASRSIVRADLQFLIEHGLARADKLQTGSGELWVAHLTPDGDDVAHGRSVHPGVKRRGLD